MPKISAPLTIEQQQLVNLLKAAHDNLALARKLKVTERKRRLDEAKIAHKRDWDAIEAQIEIDIEREIAAHEDAENEALIAAYNNSVPVRRIAQDAFGQTLDGHVHLRLRELRADGRVGNKTGYQRKELAEPVAVAFPEALDVSGTLEEALTIADPTFSRGDELELIPGNPDYTVPTVVLTLDIRDPYRKRIEKNARPGTPHLNALTATLYRHPATGEIMAHESREEGDTYWDHPVARWAKDHPEIVGFSFDAALASA